MSTSLIHDTNTPACDIITGNCPVILAGPHNGYAVPPALYDDAFRPLGLHRSCFDPLSPPRDVQIGTLSYRENEIEEHFLSFLPIACAAFGLHFARDEPYNLKNLPEERNKIVQQIRSYGADYFGLEIRNDLLTKDKPTREVARIIHDGLQGLLNK